MSTLYLIMNTFSGRYLGERTNKNIGHENMNFFIPENCKDGDGNDVQLLWFNSDGIIPAYRISERDTVNLLMVTNYSGKKDEFRVLAYAKDCKMVNGANISSQKEECKSQRYNAFVEQFPNAKYGNVLVRDIFKENTYNGNKDDKNTLATFYTKIDNVFVPKAEDKNRTIKIKSENGADIHQNMANEKMRLYVKETNEAAFNAIIANIAWDGCDKTNRIMPGYPKNSSAYAVDKTLFYATGNERDELSVSNILSYSIQSNADLLSGLCQFLLGKKGERRSLNTSLGDYLIEREDKHVDLTIKLGDATFIVENKIDSDILVYEKGVADLKEKIMKAYRAYKPGNEPTGNSRQSKKDEYNYKTAIYSEIERMVDEELDELDGTKTICQLTKYYIQTKVNAFVENRMDKPAYHFILVPDYKADKPVYKNGVVNGMWFGEEYTVIKYSELLGVFSKIEEFDYRDDIIKEFKMLSSPINDFDQKLEIFKFLKRIGF